MRGTKILIGVLVAIIVGLGAFIGIVSFSNSHPGFFEEHKISFNFGKQKEEESSGSEYSFNDPNKIGESLGKDIPVSDYNKKLYSVRSERKLYVCKYDGKNFYKENPDGTKEPIRNVESFSPYK